MNLARWLLSISAVVSLARPAHAVAPGPEEAALLEGLVLEVREHGPNRPWIVAIQNHTEQRVNLVKDSRLLSFEVRVPGKRRPTSCRLPSAMLPSQAETERMRELGPGEELRFRIDPRFYCFDGDQGVLVPGAMVEASYGFPQKTRTSRMPNGHKVVERLPSVPPYVAQFLPEEGAQNESSAANDDAANDDAANGGATEADAEEREPGPVAKTEPEPSSQTCDTTPPPQARDMEDGPAVAVPRPSDEPPPAPQPIPEDPDRPGLTSVRPVKLALGSDYSSWEPKTEAEDLNQGLKLEVVKGSDSLTARGAEVTVRVTNEGARSQRLFIRRQLITYYLLGPEGLSVCSTDEGEHAPDEQSFTTLAPGHHIQLVTRLVEFCPDSIIDRPGFYLVGAELRASADSNEPGVDAFEGTLYTTRGKIVRIQKGDQPFVDRNVPRHVLLFSSGGHLVRDTHDEPAAPPAANDDEGAAEAPEQEEPDVFDAPVESTDDN
jgi:hypothetical protein